jgi:hypothetical protein
MTYVPELFLCVRKAFTGGSAVVRGKGLPRLFCPLPFFLWCFWGFVRVIILRGNYFYCFRNYCYFGLSDLFWFVVVSAVFAFLSVSYEVLVAFGAPVFP